MTTLTMNVCFTSQRSNYSQIVPVEIQRELMFVLYRAYLVVMSTRTHGNEHV